MKLETARTTATTSTTSTPHFSKKTSALLWTLQGLLAALFLFAGVMKLVMPIEALTAQSTLPGGFLRFIGVAETLGGLGLVLPMLLRIRPSLTPLAAAGLVIIMIGATVLTAAGGIGPALIPAIVCALTAFVAVRRWQQHPPIRFNRLPTLQPAR